MDQTRKLLKISSIVVLVMMVMTLINFITELIFGDINSSVIPADAPENILLITKVIVVTVALLLLLPQIYIGMKGIKIANNPNSSKGHIIWAIILFIFAILNLIFSIVNMVENGFGENIGELLSYLLEVVIYYDYIKYAIAVARSN